VELFGESLLVKEPRQHLRIYDVRPRGRGGGGRGYGAGAPRAPPQLGVAELSGGGRLNKAAAPLRPVRHAAPRAPAPPQALTLAPRGEAPGVPGSAALIHVPEERRFLAVAGGSVSIWDMHGRRVAALQDHELWWGRPEGGAGWGRHRARGQPARLPIRER
jgi:hypothetical protein